MNRSPVSHLSPLSFSNFCIALCTCNTQYYIMNMANLSWNKLRSFSLLHPAFCFENLSKTEECVQFILNFKGRKKIPLRALLILLQSHHKNPKSKISSFCPKWRCKFINICFPWFCIIKKLKVLWSRNEIKHSAQQNPWTGFQLRVCDVCVCI